MPAIPLSGVLRDARVLIFLAVWFGINLLFGIGSSPLTGSNEVVAWQAHIGGFLAGLLLFSWFDPKLDIRQYSDDRCDAALAVAACSLTQCSVTRRAIILDGTALRAGSLL